MRSKNKETRVERNPLRFCNYGFFDKWVIRILRGYCSSFFWKKFLLVFLVFSFTFRHSYLTHKDRFTSIGVLAIAKNTKLVDHTGGLCWSKVAIRCKFTVFATPPFEEKRTFLELMLSLVSRFNVCKISVKWDIQYFIYVCCYYIFSVI